MVAIIATGFFHVVRRVEDLLVSRIWENMNEQAYAPRAQRVGSTPKTPRMAPQGAFSQLIPDLQKVVAKEGYVTPTPIQEQCIPLLLEGRDLMGTAQTGTGKTAAFCLPLLERLTENYKRCKTRAPRALILAPTRELAAQIGDSVQAYGRFLHLKHTVVFGGVSQMNQVKAMNRGVDILVATPGRLLDLMQQGYINLKEIEIFILDEVDRMLDMGFMPDIKRVLAEIPKKRQTLFFSATMAPKILELANTMVRNPARVSITPEKPTVDSIAQTVLFVGKKDKDALLVSLLGDKKVDKAIVFTQMKFSANKVVERLEKAGIKGIAIHGNKSQGARTKALDGFKRGRYRVLVATDVAARGIDVDDITHVINYDLPMEAETYVHRIGRTARAGAEGEAISFCCAEDRAYLRAIERLLGNPVPAEMEHKYHCDESFHSKLPPPKNFGRGRSGGAGGRRSGGSRSGSVRSAGARRGGPSQDRPSGKFARARKTRNRGGR